MVQTVKSIRIYPGGHAILLEKPLVLRRVFFSIKVPTDLTMGNRSRISFDDPAFHSYYVFDGQVQQLKAKGEGIYQGAIWAQNVSSIDLVFVMTEILI